MGIWNICIENKEWQELNCSDLIVFTVKWPPHTKPPHLSLRRDLHCVLQDGARVVLGEVVRHHAVTPAHHDGGVAPLPVLQLRLRHRQSLVQVDLHVGCAPQLLELPVKHGENSEVWGDFRNSQISLTSLSPQWLNYSWSLRQQIHQQPKVSASFIKVKIELYLWFLPSRVWTGGWYQGVIKAGNSLTPI